MTDETKNQKSPVQELPAVSYKPNAKETADIQFSVSLEAKQDPYKLDSVLLTPTIRWALPEEYKPAPHHLVLYLDKSSSMSTDGRLQALKTASQDLVRKFSEKNSKNRVSIVTFDGEVQTIVADQELKNEAVTAKVLQNIGDICTGMYTNLLGVLKQLGDAKELDKKCGPENTTAIVITDGRNSVYMNGGSIGEEQDLDGQGTELLAQRQNNFAAVKSSPPQLIFSTLSTSPSKDDAEEFSANGGVHYHSNNAGKLSTTLNEILEQHVHRSFPVTFTMSAEQAGIQVDRVLPQGYINAEKAGQLSPGSISVPKSALESGSFKCQVGSWNFTLKGSELLKEKKFEQLASSKSEDKQKPAGLPLAPDPTEDKKNLQHVMTKIEACQAEYEQLKNAILSNPKDHYLSRCMSLSGRIAELLDTKGLDDTNKMVLLQLGTQLSDLMQSQAHKLVESDSKKLESNEEDQLASLADITTKIYTLRRLTDSCQEVADKVKELNPKAGNYSVTVSKTHGCLDIGTPAQEKTSAYRIIHRGVNLADLVAKGKNFVSADNALHESTLITIADSDRAKLDEHYETLITQITKNAKDAKDAKDAKKTKEGVSDQTPICEYVVDYVAELAGKTGKKPKTTTPSKLVAGLSDYLPDGSETLNCRPQALLTNYFLAKVLQTPKYKGENVRLRNWHGRPDALGVSGHAWSVMSIGNPSKPGFERYLLDPTNEKGKRIFALHSPEERQAAIDHYGKRGLSGLLREMFQHYEYDKHSLLTKLPENYDAAYFALPDIAQQQFQQQNLVCPINGAILYNPICVQRKDPVSSVIYVNQHSFDEYINQKKLDKSNYTITKGTGEIQKRLAQIRSLMMDHYPQPEKALGVERAKNLRVRRQKKRSVGREATKPSLFGQTIELLSVTPPQAAPQELVVPLTSQIATTPTTATLTTASPTTATPTTATLTTASPVQGSAEPKVVPQTVDEKSEKFEEVALPLARNSFFSCGPVCAKVGKAAAWMGGTAAFGLASLTALEAAAALWKPELQVTGYLSQLSSTALIAILVVAALAAAITLVVGVVKAVQKSPDPTKVLPAV